MIVEVTSSTIFLKYQAAWSSEPRFYNLSQMSSSHPRVPSNFHSTICLRSQSSWCPEPSFYHPSQMPISLMRRTSILPFFLVPLMPRTSILPFISDVNPPDAPNLHSTIFLRCKSPWCPESPFYHQSQMSITLDDQNSFEFWIYRNVLRLPKNFSWREIIIGHAMLAVLLITGVKHLYYREV